VSPWGERGEGLTQSLWQEKGEADGKKKRGQADPRKEKKKKKRTLFLHAKGGDEGKEEKRPRRFKKRGAWSLESFRKKGRKTWAKAKKANAEKVSIPPTGAKNPSLGGKIGNGFPQKKTDGSQVGFLKKKKQEGGGGKKKSPQKKSTGGGGRGG